ncbi:MAG TPA: universal stress protein [Tepidisphaeraceae bacterium]
MKILIGYDGSDSAHEAIEQLSLAGLPADTAATVVSAADVWPPLPPSAFEAATGENELPLVRQARALARACYDEAKELAAGGAKRVAQAFPTWKVTPQAHAGSPVAALVEPPGEPADLIVVGSQGRSAISRLALGSVSQSVITHAKCSVRISRRNEKAGQYAGAPVRIVMGIDGSAYSEKAVAAVAARKWPAGSEVKLVAALDPKFWAVFAEASASPWTLAYLGEAETAGRDVAVKAVSTTAERLAAVGLKTSVVVEEGSPKRVLLHVAEQWTADCIVVGAKGHNRLDRVLLGSVSMAIAAQAPCAVEVVR